jgi:predicted O-methyltransferase YrrM
VIMRKLVIGILGLLMTIGVQADEEKRIGISLADTRYFPGDWSLTPEEIYLAIKHSTYKEKFRILEFGAGESTIQLAKLLKEKQIPYEYHVFENDPEYIKPIDRVTYHYYFLPPIPFCQCNEWRQVVAGYELPLLPVFDLIIVDGPHGVARAEWYSKFKIYTRPGTIILIDDFHHYAEFGQELDGNFAYETIVEYNHCPSWKIVNEGTDPLPGWEVVKTFKIVKVLDGNQRPKAKHLHTKSRPQKTQRLQGREQRKTLTRAKRHSPAKK